MVQTELTTYWRIGVGRWVWAGLYWMEGHGLAGLTECGYGGGFPLLTTLSLTGWRNGGTDILLGVFFYSAFLQA